MPQGTIARLQLDRGFGFITPDEGGGDLFFHHTAVAGIVFASLHEGQRVEFEAGSDPRDPRRTRANHVRVVEP